MLLSFQPVASIHLFHSQLNSPDHILNLHLVLSLMNFPSKRYKLSLSLILGIVARTKCHQTNAVLYVFTLTSTWLENENIEHDELSADKFRKQPSHHHHHLPFV